MIPQLRQLPRKNGKSFVYSTIDQLDRELAQALAKSLRPASAGLRPVAARIVARLHQLYGDGKGRVQLPAPPMPHDPLAKAPRR